MNAQFFVMGFGLASALIAVQPAASRIEGDREVSASQIQQLSLRYAKCVVSRSAPASRAFVLGGVKPPIAPDCLLAANGGDGVEMKFPGNTYRYALAEELLRKDYPVAIPDVKTAPARIYEPIDPLDERKISKNAKRAVAEREAYARLRAYRALALIGDCIPREDPQAALRLIRSEIATLEETAALTAIKPAIARCLPQNETVSMSRQVLRGMIAVGLYWMAYSVLPPVGAPPLTTEGANA